MTQKHEGRVFLKHEQIAEELILQLKNGLSLVIGAGTAQSMVGDYYIFVNDSGMQSFIAQVTNKQPNSTNIFIRLEAFYGLQKSIELPSSFLIPAPGNARHLIEAEEQFILQEIRSESRIIEYVHNYILSRGYYFTAETIANYHIALKTRPFVILTGLTGTGKTKLTRLYMEALGFAEYYHRIPVKPFWSHDQDIIGFYSFINQTFIPSSITETIIQAMSDPKNLYLLCLDEMNLARIEHYFAAFLSALEEHDYEGRKIPLMSKKQHATQTDEQKFPISLTLPSNLLFAGTINMDESTQTISDRVLDRCNTLEFDDPDLTQSLQAANSPLPALVLRFADWLSFRKDSPNPDETKNYRAQILEINDILKEVRLHFGFRTMHEIQLYLANSEGLLSSAKAFDLQVIQRILPRIHGGLEIEPMLHKLHSYLDSQKLPHSTERVKRMLGRFQNHDYTDFWTR